jgi:hypothetical protein
MYSSAVNGRIAVEGKICCSRGGLDMGRKLGIGKERVGDKTSL